MADPVWLRNPNYLERWRSFDDDEVAAIRDALEHAVLVRAPTREAAGRVLAEIGEWLGTGGR